MGDITSISEVLYFDVNSHIKNLWLILRLYLKYTIKIPLYIRMQDDIDISSALLHVTLIMMLTQNTIYLHRILLTVIDNS